MPRRLLLPLLLLGLALLTGVAHAFPPAPYFTLYGTVRDEQGQRIHAAGAVVVFYKDGVEKLRQNIIESDLLDQNYQIRLRMDMQRGGSVSYSDLANATGSSFSLAILLNNIAYTPVEMSVTRTVGQPGQRVRLDLTLGVDSDGDGLPDAWEQSQLFAAGIRPGPNGWDLSLIDRDGDFDGDGVSNWAEYVAGTFATDPTDYLALQIVAKGTASVHLQFFSIYGKVYSLESSPDLKTWSHVSLYTTNPEPAVTDTPVAPVAQASFQATSTGVVDLYADSAADSVHALFYRLKVR
ncbi:hypothetical protein K0B96_11600 [Horticoccus luteus]|uniref:F5/8 type C domain-containing protein n=1 Tax=Horticoccus luteus TaxID=2862869 RepID=A0A8F9TS16_9BACT|nr:hypothetical protein [Horticoccus luteus]QYM77956.1 hypothetical protein K0B96_11600 [Horticoccus luteus]